MDLQGQPHREFSSWCRARRVACGPVTTSAAPVAMPGGKMAGGLAARALRAGETRGWEVRGSEAKQSAKLQQLQVDGRQLVEHV